MSDNIQVAIKFRPQFEDEKNNNLEVQWEVQNNTISPLNSELRKDKENCFHFDHIFDCDKKNSEVFNSTVKSIVEIAVSGFNSTVLSYGETNSGKTFTMIGSDTDPGIIPLAIEHLFNTISNTFEREFSLKVSYYEICDDKVNDLLNIGNQDLKLFEDNNGLVQVIEGTEENAERSENILEILNRGSMNHKNTETKSDKKSHRIFRVTIESREKFSDLESTVQVSHLNLVDLSGFDLGSPLNSNGTDLSLFTLELVVNQLSKSAEFQNTNTHILDSNKLTQLLKPSLGGNAMTVMICSLNPTAIEETFHTLTFASKVKIIKNKPQLNEIVFDAALIMNSDTKNVFSESNLEKRKLQTRNLADENVEKKNFELSSYLEMDKEKYQLSSESFIIDIDTSLTQEFQITLKSKVSENPSDSNVDNDHTLQEFINLEKQCKAEEIENQLQAQTEKMEELNNEIEKYKLFQNISLNCVNDFVSLFLLPNTFNSWGPISFSNSDSEQENVIQNLKKLQEILIILKNEDNTKNHTSESEIKFKKELKTVTNEKKMKNKVQSLNYSLDSAVEIKENLEKSNERYQVEIMNHQNINKELENQLETLKEFNLMNEKYQELDKNFQTEVKQLKESLKKSENELFEAVEKNKVNEKKYQEIIEKLQNKITDLEYKSKTENTEIEINEMEATEEKDINHYASNYEKTKKLKEQCKNTKCKVRIEVNLNKLDSKKSESKVETGDKSEILRRSNRERKPKKLQDLGLARPKCNF